MYIYFSFDARKGNKSRDYDTHLGRRSQMLLSSINGPSHFDTRSFGSEDLPDVFPGWLVLKNVRSGDAGSFTCRVEFANSPTQTHNIQLTVYGKFIKNVCIQSLKLVNNVM